MKPTCKPERRAATHDKSGFRKTSGKSPLPTGPRWCNREWRAAKRLIFSALCLVLFSPLAYGAESVSELLSRAQRLIVSNRTPEALELLSRAAQLVSAMERRNLILEEQALWQSPMAHLEFADTLTNPEQRKKMASRSHDGWLDYIEWYSNLSDIQTKRLPRPNRRFNRATAHLGNAALLMAEPQRLLDEYPRHVSLLGPDALLLWKSALYACPDWRLGTERSAATRARKICDDSCNEHWVTYAESLRDWLRTFPLKESARAPYRREIDQILAAARQCV